MDLTILYDWAMAIVRWAHVIVAMGWIGTSFYFIALDLGLNRGSHNPEGVAGDEWQVHGGGFYHVQKYQVAPAHMPNHLTWFKWESYATWLSGFALLALMYYLGADLYLVDPNVADLPILGAVAISVASLVVGWIVYDTICKSPLGRNSTTLMILLFCLLVLMAWGYTQVFSGRAAMLHLGAFTASIMTGNVFFIIMPNQRIVVADLIAGRTPDAKYGVIAKQRSTHNNYLTLPVIFLMLSNHYPMVFASDLNWIIASLIFLMGVSIRTYFNRYHAKQGVQLWPWAVALVLLTIIIILSLAPTWRSRSAEPVRLSATSQRLMQHPGYDQAVEIVQARCTVCHAAEPIWQGLRIAPKGVILETDAEIAKQARQIYLHSAVSNAMPPANKSGMTQDERLLLAQWYRNEYISP